MGLLVSFPGIQVSLTLLSARSVSPGPGVGPAVLEAEGGASRVRAGPACTAPAPRPRSRRTGLEWAELTPSRDQAQPVLEGQPRGHPCPQGSRRDKEQRPPNSIPPKSIKGCREQ